VTAPPPATPDRPRPPGPFHIPSLDGLRAVSFLIVFLSHAGLKGKVPGYFGLSVFFFLSGYLITTLLRMEFDGAGTVSFKQFYLRRALRIFPPFYTVLALAYAVTALGLWGGTLSWPAVSAQLLHFTNYYIVANGWWEGIAPGTWVYWSLAVEEHFYLFFPVVYLWMRRRGWSASQQARLIVGACLVILAWRCVLVFGLEASKDRLYVATDTRIDSILAGCLLAVWKNPVLDRDGPSDRQLGLLWLPLGTACVLVSVFVARTLPFEQTLRYTLQSFGLLPFFLAAIRWYDKGPFALLNTRLLKYLGLLSYSMYLTHTSVIWGLEHWLAWPEPLRAALALLIIIALAFVIHHGVERPVGRLRKRLIAQKPAA
jgi:peptidoglycan/LPS O-acetylase OafA/YrhL